MPHEAPLALDEARLLSPQAGRSLEMEAVWAWLKEQDAGLPNWLDLPPAEARRLHDGLTRRWNAILPDVELVEPLLLPAARPLPCQLIVPPSPTAGCILFLHGGGWAFGNLETHQRFMRLLALATRTRVLGVDYRLAPEQPYPAPLDDARSAWRWLAGRPRADLAGPLAIAGDSAGANLAMGVMLAAAQGGDPMPDAALLFYGAYRSCADSPSARRFAEGYGLTRAAMERFWRLYVPDPLSDTDPLVSAVHAPDALLSRLPPLYLNAAGLDPLLSDTIEMEQRLRSAGVTHHVEFHAGLHHGFMQMSLRLPEAQTAIDKAAAWLRDPRAFAVLP